ncbi:hypothetical protein BMS3Bbin04_00286 [bacterium BMS3Bbin04]|nr:hypothetical protein BMS3Bbin04_00286 [bacterium BMS3Bbin04]
MLIIVDRNAGRDIGKLIQRTRSLSEGEGEVIVEGRLEMIGELAINLQLETAGTTIVKVDVSSNRDRTITLLDCGNLIVQIAVITGNLNGEIVCNLGVDTQFVSHRTFKLEVRITNYPLVNVRCRRLVKLQEGRQFEEMTVIEIQL